MRGIVGLVRGLVDVINQLVVLVLILGHDGCTRFVRSLATTQAHHDGAVTIQATLLEISAERIEITRVTSETRPSLSRSSARASTASMLASRVMR